MASIPFEIHSDIITGESSDPKDALASCIFSYGYWREELSHRDAFDVELFPFYVMDRREHATREGRMVEDIVVCYLSIIYKVPAK